MPKTLDRLRKLKKEQQEKKERESSSRDLPAVIASYKNVCEMYYKATKAYSTGDKKSTLKLFQSLAKLIQSEFTHDEPATMRMSCLHMLDDSLVRIKCIKEGVKLTDVNYDYPNNFKALQLIDEVRASGDTIFDNPNFFDTELTILLSCVRRAEIHKEFSQAYEYVKKANALLALMHAHDKINTIAHQYFFDMAVKNFIVVLFKNTVKHDDVTNYDFNEEGCLVPNVSENAVDLIKVLDFFKMVKNLKAFGDASIQLFEYCVEKEWTGQAMVFATYHYRALYIWSREEATQEERVNAKQTLDQLSKHMDKEWIDNIVNAYQKKQPVLPILEEKPRDLSDAVLKRNLPAIKAMSGDAKEKLDALLLAIKLEWVDGCDVLVGKMLDADRDFLLSQVQKNQSKVMFFVFMLFEHRAKIGSDKLAFVNLVTDILFDLKIKPKFVGQEIEIAGHSMSLVKLRQFLSSVWKKHNDENFVAVVKEEINGELARIKAADDAQQLRQQQEQQRQQAEQVRIEQARQAELQKREQEALDVQRKLAVEQTRLAEQARQAELQKREQEALHAQRKLAAEQTRLAEQARQAELQKRKLEAEKVPEAKAQKPALVVLESQHKQDEATAHAKELKRLEDAFQAARHKYAIERARLIEQTKIAEQKLLEEMKAQQPSPWDVPVAQPFGARPSIAAMLIKVRTEYSQVRDIRAGEANEAQEQSLFNNQWF